MKKLKSKYVVECMAVFCSIMILFVMIFYKSDSNVMVDNVLEDVYFAIYVNGTPSTTFPSRDSGYMLDTSQSSCTNGASILWNDEEWSTIVDFTNYQSSETNRTKCTLYFKNQDFNSAMATCDDTAVNCFKKNASLSSEIVNDETADNNLRYIGANPNNYVWFNYELWRIIGVMNNINNGSGTKETRLKIIRDEQIGAYFWDNDGYYGSNDWSDSALQIVLNSGAYYNRTSGECPNGSYGATTSCDFSTTGLTSDAKSMISNAVWNLGGSSTYNDVTTSMFYARERGTTVYTGRPTTWTGQIGLMYPSDYGYATSGGSTTNRSSCLTKQLYNWDSVTDCYNNNWLYYPSDAQWTLTSYSAIDYVLFAVSNGGRVFYASFYLGSPQSYAVSPVLYLSSNVKITGGTGSSSDPYQLSL